MNYRTNFYRAMTQMRYTLRPKPLDWHGHMTTAFQHAETALTKLASRICEHRSAFNVLPAHVEQTSTNTIFLKLAVHGFGRERIHGHSDVIRNSSCFTTALLDRAWSNSEIEFELETQLAKAISVLEKHNAQNGMVTV